MFTCAFDIIWREREKAYGGLNLWKSTDVNLYPVWCRKKNREDIDDEEEDGDNGDDSGVDDKRNEKCWYWWCWWCMVRWVRTTSVCKVLSQDGVAKTMRLLREPTRSDVYVLRRDVKSVCGSGFGGRAWWCWRGWDSDCRQDVEEGELSRKTIGVTAMRIERRVESGSTSIRSRRGVNRQHPSIQKFHPAKKRNKVQDWKKKKRKENKDSPKLTRPVMKSGRPPLSLSPRPSTP